MATRTNYRYIEPADSDAEKACRLTPEIVAVRQEPPESFFASAHEQKVLANGYELRFAAGPDMPSRLKAFIAEERECCPFFAFEHWEEPGDVVLRILRPDDKESE
jgi:hypothetical protein